MIRFTYCILHDCWLNKRTDCLPASILFKLVMDYTLVERVPLVTVVVVVLVRWLPEERCRLQESFAGEGIYRPTATYNNMLISEYEFSGL